MILTLEAIYLLHLLNGFSDPLVFLSLPNPESLELKELLKKTVDQGYYDLQKAGLLEDNEITEEGAKLGYYLKEYAENGYHYAVDNAYFIAPQVDDYKRMSVVIKQIEEKSYFVDRVSSALLWAYLLEGHKMLHHIEDKMKDYTYYDWKPYSHLRLMVKSGDSDGLRITTLVQGQLLDDTLYYLNQNSYYEYDMIAEQQRSIDHEDLFPRLIEKGKVRI
ncbi:DUF5081 family protein [Streptococcus caprae]|uniref:DUF5081 family protein n=1 Tax=Streptococcus caprae TaxID=1640501 RepID=A0ABV8CXL2_9STRE